LKGNLSGFYSIRINDQWRIIFKWLNGEPHAVQIVDLKWTPYLGPGVVEVKV
jgi:plasmid maintenance system killer protein